MESLIGHLGRAYFSSAQPETWIQVASRCGNLKLGMSHLLRRPLPGQLWPGDGAVPQPVQDAARTTLSAPVRVPHSPLLSCLSPPLCLTSLVPLPTLLPRPLKAWGADVCNSMCWAKDKHTTDSFARKTG